MMTVKHEPTPAAWDDATLRSPHAQADKARRVERMFNAIAPTYEKVNRVATFGLDARWRRRTIQVANPQPGEVVLDLCCGTGDMIRAFAGAQPRLARLVGLDFAAEMLAAGDYTDVSAPVALLRADALRLPIATASVDIVSCAFGVRNYQAIDRGLTEMRRVLRSTGRAVILEFANPENPLLRWGHRIYCEAILPRLGAWIARDRSGAYRYLPRSIETFDTPSIMSRRLRDAGFASVSVERMNFGGVVLYGAHA